MYENGERCRGYFAKQIHKRKMMRRTALIFGKGSYNQLVAEEEDKRIALQQLYGSPLKGAEWFRKYWKYYTRYCFYNNFEHRQQLRRERHKKIDLNELMPD